MSRRCGTHGIEFWPEDGIGCHMCENEQARAMGVQRNAAARRERVAERFERLLIADKAVDGGAINSFERLWGWAEEAEAFIEEKRK